jgi:prolipoprotein diacylglyceryltransferase
MTWNMGQLLSLPFIAVGLYFYIKARGSLPSSQDK